MPFPTARTWLCLAVAAAVQHTGVEGSSQAHTHASQRIAFPKWSDTNFLEDDESLSHEHFGPAAEGQGWSSRSSMVPADSGVPADTSTDTCPSSLHYIYQVDVDVTNFQSYGREMQRCSTF